MEKKPVSPETTEVEHAATMAEQQFSQQGTKLLGGN